MLSATANFGRHAHHYTGSRVATQLDRAMPTVDQSSAFSARRCQLAVSVYNGPAAVVLANGQWFHVVASLESTGLPGNEMWRGTITTDDRPALWSVLTAGQATLLVAPAWQGHFASPRVEGPDGQTLRVMGHGRGPF